MMHHAVHITHLTSKAAQKTTKRCSMQGSVWMPLGSACTVPHSLSGYCRYAVVYHRGGMYADLDAECYEAIDRWVPQPECRVALTLENDDQFGQYAFAAEAKHPLFARVVNSVKQTIIHRSYQVGIPKHDGVLEFAGPTLFSRVVLFYLKTQLGIHVPSRKGGLNDWRSDNDAELRRHGICVLDSAQMAAFLENHMSSFNPVLQSDSLGGSWRDREDEVSDMENERRHKIAVAAAAAAGHGE
jgi:hypothetical protein